MENIGENLVADKAANALAEALKIAHEAQSQRSKLDADLAQEKKNSQIARDSVAASDKKLQDLQSRLNELANMNHLEGAMLLSRCRDFTDGLRKKAEAELLEAKNLHGMAGIELQAAQDSKRQADEKLALIESKGKITLDKMWEM